MTVFWLFHSSHVTGQKNSCWQLRAENHQNSKFRKIEILSTTAIHLPCPSPALVLLPVSYNSQ